MSSIDVKLDRLLQTKNDIKTAIQTKGQSITDTTKFSEYANKIKNIKTGVELETVELSFGTSIREPTEVSVYYVKVSSSGVSPVNENVNILTQRVSNILAYSYVFVTIWYGEGVSHSFDQGNWNFTLVTQGNHYDSTTTKTAYALMSLTNKNPELYVY